MLSAFIKEEINSCNLDTSPRHFQSGRSQTHNIAYRMILLIENSEKSKLTVTESRTMVFSNWEWSGSVNYHGHKGTFWGVKNILYPDLSGVYTRAYNLQILSCAWFYCMWLIFQ